MRQNIATAVAAILLITVIAAVINFWPGMFDVRLGLDLKGGAQVLLEARPQPGVPADVQKSNLHAASDVVANRVNGSGVSEPLVQLQGNNRIIVELPGVKDPDQVIKTMRETGYLEWINSGDQQLPVGSLVTTDKGPPTPDQIRAYQQGSGTSPITNTQSLTPTGTLTSTAGITPTGSVTSTAGITSTGTVSPTTGFVTYNNGQVFPVIVTGAEVDGTKVTAGIDPQTNTPEVQFTLKGDGPNKLRDFTQNNINKYMPIVLDKKVISSPVIQGAIPNGVGVINHMTASEAQALAIQLRYGALPVALDVVSNRTIGPTLGAEGVQRSLVAGAVGLTLVMLFMLLFYRLPGLLADIALLIFAMVTFAIFRVIPVTLTLAGIAGFILSIGMAVDANVLIFARIKEELRSGKTIGAAVEAGFDHAFPSIRDSNATTLIITAILYWFGGTFGASVIKGFALTLFISVLISLLTAFFVSRTFLRLVVRLPLAKNQWWFGIDQPKRVTPPPTEGGIQPVG